MATVTLSNLEKIYGTDTKAPFRAVKQINLEIRDREFLVLVGPSGCGKTTTLRMIAGLEGITGGDVLIDDTRVNDVLPKNRDIAMVFQNYALYPHMTVSENMAFGLRLRKMAKDEITRRVDEAAEMLGLSALLDRKPKALSGGQRQRVAVGRAIVRKPKVFLFDEPLSNLDAKMRVQMRTEISRLHAQLDATMVYVTHDQTEAMTMGDRICVMNDGEIMQVAEPIDLYRKPANLFVASFIGSPAMNLIHGQFSRDGNQVTFKEHIAGQTGQTITITGPAATIASEHLGKPVVLGVRPEDLHLAKTPAAIEYPIALSATVDVVELMGPETYAYLKTPAHALIARLSGAPDLYMDQALDLHIDGDKVHLFDPESGMAY